MLVISHRQNCLYYTSQCQSTTLRDRLPGYQRIVGLMLLPSTSSSKSAWQCMVGASATDVRAGLNAYLESRYRRLHKCHPLTNRSQRPNLPVTSTRMPSKSCASVTRLSLWSHKARMTSPVIYSGGTSDGLVPLYIPLIIFRTTRTAMCQTRKDAGPPTIQLGVHTPRYPDSRRVPLCLQSAPSGHQIPAAGAVPPARALSRHFHVHTSPCLLLRGTWS